MFSGIVRSVGCVRSMVPITSSWGAGYRILIDNHLLDAHSLQVGASVSVSGICLTVEEVLEDAAFYVSVSQATLSCTTPFMVGQLVNLEPSLSLQDLVSGHFVSGHVDGVGEVVAFDLMGESRRLCVRLPRSLMKFLARKGSIAVNGVSLTLNSLDLSAGTFEINLIPHTLKITQLGRICVGDSVNIEVDMLARYVVNYCDAMALRDPVLAVSESD